MPGGGFTPDGMLVGPNRMPRGPRFDPFGPGGVDPDNDALAPPGHPYFGQPPGTLVDSEGGVCEDETAFTC